MDSFEKKESLVGYWNKCWREDKARYQGHRRERSFERLPSSYLVITIGADPEDIATLEAARSLQAEISYFHVQSTGSRARTSAQSVLEGAGVSSLEERAV